MPTENRSSNTEMVSVQTTIESLEEAYAGDSAFDFMNDATQLLRQFKAISTSQPHPEPVALPARMPTGNITEPHHPWAPGVREGWNNCLDEITKLGPLYTRSVQGEPVVPGHRLDALDALVADGDPQSDANVSNANVAELIRAVRTLQVRTITGPAEPGEVERLRAEVKRLDLMVAQADHNYDMDRATFRRELAERDALLVKANYVIDHARTIDKQAFARGTENVDYGLFRGLGNLLSQYDEALSASAEPSAPVEVDHDALVAAVCVLRSQGLGNLSAAVEEARAALEHKPS